VAELIVALDTGSLDEALALFGRVRAVTPWVKVGLELYTAEGPRAVRELRAAGARVFLDLKLHDIPAQVAGAVRSAGRLGVELLTLHAAGGPAMLKAAREAAPEGLALLAVTVLTSIGAEDADALGVPPPASWAPRLARLAWASGAHGVVAAVTEAVHIRSEAPPGFRILTPGIRPAGAEAGDQKRVATPAAAVRAGSDYLVVGRPITGAADPAAAARRVWEEMAG
jgi:orotidine-5'-phosphate decarboxylase